MPKTDQVASPNATINTVDSTADNLSTPGNPGDPKNPAGAPRLQLVIDDDARREADDELQGLFRKDTSEMTQPERAAHDKRVFDLHYLANGEQPPKR